jgi:hypothetical protein
MALTPMFEVYGEGAALWIRPDGIGWPWQPRPLLATRDNLMFWSRRVRKSSWLDFPGPALEPEPECLPGRLEN